MQRALREAGEKAEHKRAEEALQRRANLLEQTHDAILAWELSGNIVYWNRGAEHLYGFSREEAIGHSSHDLLRQTPMPTEKFEALIERQGTWSGELMHTTREWPENPSRESAPGNAERIAGSFVWRRTGTLLSANAPRKSARGCASRADLSRVDRVSMMGGLAASLAHEIKQPMAAVAASAVPACGGSIVSTLRRKKLAKRQQEYQRRKSCSRHHRSSSIPVQAGTPKQELVDLNELIREDDGAAL